MHLNVRVARSEEGMERIAQATGGSAFIPKNDADLDNIFRRIGSEIRSQYLIQYYSNNQAAGHAFRKIAVTTPNQTQLHVRAREGYYPKSQKPDRYGGLFNLRRSCHRFPSSHCDCDPGLPLSRSGF